MKKLSLAACLLMATAISIIAHQTEVPKTQGPLPRPEAGISGSIPQASRRGRDSPSVSDSNEPGLVCLGLGDESSKIHISLK